MIAYALSKDLHNLVTAFYEPVAHLVSLFFLLRFLIKLSWWESLDIASLGFWPHVGFFAVMIGIRRYFSTVRNYWVPKAASLLTHAKAGSRRDRLTRSLARSLVDRPNRVLSLVGALIMSGLLQKYAFQGWPWAFWAPAVALYLWGVLWGNAVVKAAKRALFFNGGAGQRVLFRYFRIQTRRLHTQALEKVIGMMTQWVEEDERYGVRQPQLKSEALKADPDFRAVLDYWGMLLVLEGMFWWIPSSEILLGGRIFRQLDVAVSRTLALIPLSLIFGLTAFFVWRQKGHPLGPRLHLPFLSVIPWVRISVAPMAWLSEVQPQIGVPLFSSGIRYMARRLPMVRATEARRRLFEFLVRVFFLDNFAAFISIITALVFSAFGNLPALGLQRGGALAGAGALYLATVLWHFWLPNQRAPVNRHPKIRPWRGSLILLVAIFFLTHWDMTHSGILWRVGDWLGNANLWLRTVLTAHAGVLGAAALLRAPGLDLRRHPEADGKGSNLIQSAA